MLPGTIDLASHFSRNLASLLPRTNCVCFFAHTRQLTSNQWTLYLECMFVVADQIAIRVITIPFQIELYARTLTNYTMYNTAKQQGGIHSIGEKLSKGAHHSSAINYKYPTEYCTCLNIAATYLLHGSLSQVKGKQY